MPDFLHVFFPQSPTEPRQVKSLEPCNMQGLYGGGGGSGGCGDVGVLCHPFVLLLGRQLSDERTQSGGWVVGV